MYKDHQIWKERELILPEEYRLTKQNQPTEIYIDWSDWKIHLDFYKNSEAKAKVILLHGVGGNGRVLSFVAVPLHRAGFELIIPDLPGYGHSIGDKKKVTYSHWVDLVSHIIQVESKKDNRPIFIFGLSAGGMLAYHAAAKSHSVKGVIATNLLDQRNQKVRDYSSGNIVLSRIGIPMLKILSRINGSFMLPMKAVANMKAIVNNIKMLNILLQDKAASGTKVPIRFITSLVEAKPAIEPEMFDLPLLLAHPEFDEWTPVFISEIFFSRIKGKKELKILNNAGHFPIEKPGIDQLPKYVQDFINQNLL